MSGLKDYYHLVIIIIITDRFAPGKCNDGFCGKTDFMEPKDTIQSDHLGRYVFKNCSWTIKTPPKSVILLRLEDLELGRYPYHLTEKINCLFIKSPDRKIVHLATCNTDDERSTFKSFSIPSNEIVVDLEITSETYISMSYTSYIVNCSYEQLNCSKWKDKNISKGVCLDGTLYCTPGCRNRAIQCGDFCYDVLLQRCDAHLDCPRGEDEIGCNPRLCPNTLQCPNETKCVQPDQICDNHMDCKDGFDEARCPKLFCDDEDFSCYVEKSRRKISNGEDPTIIIIFLLVVFFLIFLLLLCKCVGSRQDVRDMLEHPLDIPLPPFRGPGETTTSNEEAAFAEEDFKPGGEIYENFIKNMNKIKSRRKTLLEIEEAPVTRVKPQPGKSVVEKYFNGVRPSLSEELASLATLKISREMCIGLNRSKSDDRQMTRLLFIDNKDDESSDEYEEEMPEKYFKKGVKLEMFSKSDTECFRRHQTNMETMV